MKSAAALSRQALGINIIRHLLTDDGRFPNNEVLPLLIYRGALNLQEPIADGGIKDLFDKNGWVNAWTDGVLPDHHYHSTAHEVLGIVKGGARLQFGGPSGVSLWVEKGDVVIIPAGVAHKNMGSDNDFSCVGAYPNGQEYDMLYGRDGERPAADKNIKRVPLPLRDPVFGVSGPLINIWQNDADKHESIDSSSGEEK